MLNLIDELLNLALLIFFGIIAVKLVFWVVVLLGMIFITP